jgi:tRNA-splicing ligase RtcB
MVHSGSRNFGFKVAEHYNNLAKKLYLKYNGKEVERRVDLAFLMFDSKEGQLYYKEMMYCTQFALGNRKLMIERIQEVLVNAIKDIKFEPKINIAHNYAAMEEHFGEQVLVHRKGATSAKHGELGIIPGSQGTKSYIVEGLGNPESFMSCSHGAGRVMSRTAAINKLDLAKEKKKLEDQGIIHAIRGRNDLEEAMSCYKDIQVVMELQKDLVSVKVELTPLAVVKG